MSTKGAEFMSCACVAFGKIAERPREKKGPMKKKTDGPYDEQFLLLQPSLFVITSIN